jgi:hypothetical protein
MCRPPVFILKAGDQKIPIWPAPPRVLESERPEFCPKDYRMTIIEKFRIHFHQHPSIPNVEGSLLTADEIYKGAVNDMYRYCFSNNLSQVWAYMWNRWYMPKQWTLWARAACDAISRLKTTMVVENLWKHIKRCDLAQYNRPRLDLVTHLVITGVLPWVQLTLASILDRRRVGRAKALVAWQTEFRHHWREMSLSDEERLVKKELAVWQESLKGKKRDERLEQIANEEGHKPGQYHTNLQTWTCSCQSYLISRFLLCKHLVRLTNKKLQNKPLTQLKFFADLQRARYTPFYNILKGIHCELEPDTTSSADEEEVEIIMLGGYGPQGLTRRSVTENKHSRSGISSSLDKEDPSSSKHVAVMDIREECGLGAKRTAADLDNMGGDITGGVLHLSGWARHEKHR